MPPQCGSKASNRDDCQTTLIGLLVRCILEEAAIGHVARDGQGWEGSQQVTSVGRRPDRRGGPGERDAEIRAPGARGRRGGRGRGAGGGGTTRARWW